MAIFEQTRVQLCSLGRYHRTVSWGSQEVRRDDKGYHEIATDKGNKEWINATAILRLGAAPINMIVSTYLTLFTSNITYDSPPILLFPSLSPFVDPCYCSYNLIDIGYEVGAIPDEAEERDGDNRAKERYNRGGFNQRCGHQDEYFFAECQDDHQG